MITRPSDLNQFTFVTVAALRAAQLMGGCTPRVPRGPRHAVTARHEVAAGKVTGTWQADVTTARARAAADDPRPTPARY